MVHNIHWLSIIPKIIRYAQIKKNLKMMIGQIGRESEHFRAESQWKN